MPESRQNDWVIAEVRRINGYGGVFRYRTSKPNEWKSTPLSEEISISWKYEGPLPDKITAAAMAQFEEALEQLSDTSDAKLVLVMTVGGLHEWCYYTCSYEMFMGLLNQSLVDKPRFPITIEHSHDPEWRYWHSFVDRLETIKPAGARSLTGVVKPPPEN